MKFRITKYAGEDIHDLIDLAKTYYKDNDMTNVSYLKWQYFNNPGGFPYLFLSREQLSNELSGQYLVIPVEFNFFNNKEIICLSLNTLTAPKYQGKGLFTKMALETYRDCAKQNIKFIIYRTGIRTFKV